MNLLLLGAGFSKNWGGWLAQEVFEWLLGHPAIAASVETRKLLWNAQRKGGGFEEALSDIQQAHARDSRANQATLEAMQAAVSQMFDEMNKALHERRFEFSQDRQWQVSTFLTRFDAIFTLNQDTLLEHHYCNDNVSLNSSGRWSGACLPGLEPGAVMDGAFRDSWAYREWTPSRDGRVEVARGAQPIYKLHGSSNWRSANGGALLVVGGAKSKAIADTPVLLAYMDQFQRMLSERGAKLMTIGYGFRDAHINDVIVAGAKDGLRLFNISPSGSAAAKDANPNKVAQIQGPNTPMEDAFESSLIGASQRPLSSIFSDDIVEHRKVLRFFD